MKYCPVNLEKDAYDLAKKIGGELQWSGKQFVENAILAIAQLVEQSPEKRSVPDFVLAIDALREARKEPVSFPIKKALQSLSVKEALNASKLPKSSQSQSGK